MVKTAKEWGKPPTFIATHTDGTWTERDRVMVMGFELFKSTICPECGNPLSVCRDPGRDGWFQVQEDTCYAKKAMDEHTSDKTYKPQPGQVIYPVLEEGSSEQTSYGANPFAD